MGGKGSGVIHGMYLTRTYRSWKMMLSSSTKNWGVISLGNLSEGRSEAGVMEQEEAA